MSRVHINPHLGIAKPCNAQKGQCPFGEENHYGSIEQAQKAYETSMQGETFRPLRKYEDLEKSMQIINDAEEKETAFFAKPENALTPEATAQTHQALDSLMADLEKRANKKWTLSSADKKVFDYVYRKARSVYAIQDAASARARIAAMERAYEDIVFGYQARNKLKGIAGKRGNEKASSSVELIYNTLSQLPQNARLCYDRAEDKGYTPPLSQP